MLVLCTCLFFCLRFFCFLLQNCKKFKIDITKLGSPCYFLEASQKLYNSLAVDEGLFNVTQLLSLPLARLFKIIFSARSFSKSSSSVPKRSGGAYIAQQLNDGVVNLWKLICLCFQSRYNSAYSNKLLSIFSPLLVCQKK